MQVCRTGAGRWGPVREQVLCGRGGSTVPVQRGPRLAPREARSQDVPKSKDMSSAWSPCFIRSRGSGPPEGSKPWASFFPVAEGNCQ